MCFQESFTEVAAMSIFGDAGRRLETVMYRLGKLRFLLLPFLVVLAFLAATFE